MRGWMTRCMKLRIDWLKDLLTVLQYGRTFARWLDWISCTSCRMGRCRLCTTEEATHWKGDHQWSIRCLDNRPEPLCEYITILYAFCIFTPFRYAPGIYKWSWYRCSRSTPISTPLRPSGLYSESNEVAIYFTYHTEATNLAKILLG